MNLKKLLEKREAKQEQMKKILEKAKTEERDINEEEKNNFDNLAKEIREINNTISAIIEMRELEEDDPAPEEERKNENKKEDDEEKRELRAFDAFLRNKVMEVEERDDVNITYGENGAVVPKSIANKIIDKVVDMCPIYHDAERYNVKGTLTIPYYDTESGDITMSYADEFTDGESTSGKFKNITLTGFLARALTDVSKSLINNSNFNIIDFVVNKMSQQIALFIEKELLKGTPDKIEGLSGVKQIVNAQSSTAITADEIIDLQEEVPDIYQTNAYFIMNKKTRTAIRKLKDSDGNYILNKDATSRWGYTLFGKDVYTSGNMDKMESGKTVIYYGDYTGLAVKVSEEVNIEVLRETKARQHAVEVIGFVELDAKVQDGQKIAALKMKTA